jgi:hypothetical protein
MRRSGGNVSGLPISELQPRAIDASRGDRWIKFAEHLAPLPERSRTRPGFRTTSYSWAKYRASHGPATVVVIQ